MLKNISSSISYPEGSDKRRRVSTRLEGMGLLWAKSLLLMLFILALSGCGGSGSPVDAMRRSLDRYPEYSVILNDMSSKGLLFHDYFHRYRVIFPESGQKSGEGGEPKFTQKMTSWVKVDEATYNKYKDSLGMVLLAKKADGTIDTVPQPPLFQLIGDPRFGKWETDDKGNNAWAWLATGMMASRLLEGLGGSYDSRGQVDYRHWQDYSNSRRSGTPYYGSKDPQGRPQYGTQGTVTQKSNPGFFEQQQARMAEQKASFGQKVESRMGRSRPTPSGSSGFSSSGRSSFSSGSRSRR
jgi:hypothetical protein